jgi:hypothetical protein
MKEMLWRERDDDATPYEITFRNTSQPVGD